jgi:hypothetical protein
MVGSVKEKEKFVFRMILDDSPRYFIGVPSKTFHFIGNQKASIDGDPH